MWLWPFGEYLFSYVPSFLCSLQVVKSVPHEDPSMISRLQSIPSKLFNLAPFSRLDPNTKELLRGAIGAFGLRVLGAGLGFTFSVLLARSLGAEGTGMFFLALSTVSVAAVFSRLGLDNVLLRYISAGAASGNWTMVKGVYRQSMKMAAPASVLSALGLFMLAPHLSELVFKKPELTVPMRWMSLAAVPMALSLLHAESIKGLKHISAALFIQSVSAPAFCVLGISLVTHFGGVLGAVWVYTSGSMCTLILGVWLWTKLTPHLKNQGGYFETRRLVATSMPLFVVAFMNLIMNSTSTFVLGIWGTSGDVGVFNVANRSALLTSFVLIAVNSVAAPKFAELHQKGDIQSLAHTARTSAKFTFIMASPMLMICMFCPSWLMSMFGSEFSTGGFVLFILAVGQFVNVSTGSVGYLLMMCGYEKLMRNNIIFAAILGIILNVSLVPKWGTTGAAIATSIGLSTLNIISAALVYRKLSISLLPLWKGLSTYDS